VGANMMNALSRHVLKPRSANDYRALAVTLVPPFLRLVCRLSVSVCRINQPRAKTDLEKVRCTRVRVRAMRMKGREERWSWLRKRQKRRERESQNRWKRERKACSLQGDSLF